MKRKRKLESKGKTSVARKSLPDSLEIADSLIPEAGEGVFAKETILKGRKFGPYEGKRLKKGEINSKYGTKFIWEILKENGQVSHCVDGSNENDSNWMRFINCARTDEEQNLYAFQYDKNIFYRTYKEIPAGQELLVWYGDTFADSLGISLSNDIGNFGFRCKYCCLAFVSSELAQSHEPICRDRNEARVSEITPFQNGSESFESEDDVDEKKSTTGKRYDCVECERSFSNINGLKLHQKAHAAGKLSPKTCDECGKSFATLQKLKYHIKCHDKNKPFSCTECNKAFPSVFRLKQHEITHSEERPFKCTRCEKAFATNRRLEVHTLKMHTRDMPYKCSACGRKFEQMSELRTHERIHEGNSLYNCEECGRSFVNMNGLRSHQKAHADGRLSTKTCDECGKSFANLQKLKRHLKIHYSKKPFSCIECKKTFTLACQLKYHQTIHSKARPFKCTQCDKAFRRNAHLELHLRIHTGEKPYTCSDCGKRFNQSSALRTHQRIHGDSSPYSCEECGKCFRHKTTLTSHQMLHSGIKPYACKYCGKSFTQACNKRTHERIHSGEKRYICHICGITLSHSTSNLKSHLQTHTKNIMSEGKYYKRKLPSRACVRDNVSDS